MADNTPTYQEVSAAIASILMRHPQFESLFHSFELLPWLPADKGLMKKNKGGGIMHASRDKISGKINITFSTP